MPEYLSFNKQEDCPVCGNRKVKIIERETDNSYGSVTIERFAEGLSYQPLSKDSIW